VRRKGLIRLGVLAVSAGALIVLILIIAGRGQVSKRPETRRNYTAEGPAEIRSLLTGIPQSANVLGRPGAPVTLQYFGDLECPICKLFSLGAFPAIVQRWVRTGKLKIEYRSLETATRQPEVFKNQQMAALAAGRQNLLWYFVELFYHEQRAEGSGYVTESYLQNLAQQVPTLDLPRWMSDRSDAELLRQVVTDAQAAAEAGLTGTPAFLVGKTGHQLRKLDYTSLTDSSSFNTALEKLLRN
jgi:protein-disulfide isomerase